jgi:hypothetical protein
MPESHDEDFLRQRCETFSKVIALVDGHTKAATPTVVIRLQEKSPDALRANAAVEAWSLFLNGIRHLKDGAPDGQPGAMTEALSRASLRASPFAAALGIRPPHFEPLYFSVDYTTGAEAALFLCRRLVEAAAADFPKSRQIIQQKILSEKPAVDTLKEQMALSFDVLAETYERVCGELKSALSVL